MASYFIKLPKVSGGGGGAWGTITGTLSDQTDLQSALNAKADDNAVVKLTGTQTVAGAKTFSDDVTVSKTTGNAAVIVDAALATDAKNLTFQTAGLNRWRFRVDGANDDLAIRRYDNAGVFIDAPISVDRATGVATINGSTMASKQDTLTNPVTGTGTSGQVSFWNGTSTQGGSNNLFWNNSTNRLGINTNSPSEVIHAIGSAWRGQNSNIDGSAKDFAIVLGHHTTAEEAVSLFSTISNAGQGIIFIGGGSASYNSVTDIRFFTSVNNTTTTGTERMRINGSGQVSIGTTAAIARLGVVNESAGGVASIIRGAASQSANLTQWQDGAGTVLASVSSNGTIISDSLFRLTHAASSRTAIEITKSGDDGVIDIYRDGAIDTKIQGNANSYFAATSGTSITIGSTSSIARFGVVNSSAGTVAQVIRGAVSQTANLTEWQDGSASVLVNISAAGNFLMNSATARIFMGNTSSQAGMAYDSSSTGLLLRSNRISTPGYCFTFSSGQGNISATSGISGRITTGQGFAPTSGTGVWNSIAIVETINQTGGANGITRGLHVNPTLTAAADYRGVQVDTSGDTVILGRNTGTAAVQIDSTTRGFLPPRMTTAQRNAITSPVAGLTIFNTTTTKLEVYDGTIWQAAW